MIASQKDYCVWFLHSFSNNCCYTDHQWDNKVRSGSTWAALLSRRFQNSNDEKNSVSAATLKEQKCDPLPVSPKQDTGAGLLKLILKAQRNHAKFLESATELLNIERVKPKNIHLGVRTEFASQQDRNPSLAVGSLTGKLKGSAVRYLKSSETRLSSSWGSRRFVRTRQEMMRSTLCL